MNINVMSRNSMKLIAPAVLAIAASLASAEGAKAGALRGSWNAPVYANYGSAYSGNYSTYYRYRAFYSPIFYPFTARYSPVGNSCCVPTCSPCSPCNSCSPCGVGSPCQVSSAAKTGAKLTPEKEANGLPKTFKDGGEPPKPMGDSKFNERGDSKKFEPTRKQDGDQGPGGSGEAIKQQANKNPENKKEPPESVIKKRKPAPAGSAKGSTLR